MRRFVDSYGGEDFDVVVIGGGITGSAVAYDASLRGLKTALVEKNDFGSATSSATSKMIHGGFRYLANMEFSMIRESLRERRIMENIAPNFVYPFPVMITTGRSNIKTSRWLVKIGMMLYDVLSFDKGRTWDRSKRLPCHRALSADEVLAAEPNVRESGLTGAMVFYDCISIFPERLVLAFVKSAAACGAMAANYTEAIEFIKLDGKIEAVIVRDKESGCEFPVRTKLVINCTGPWVDSVLGLATDVPVRHIRRSEGIHVVVDRLVNEYIVGALAASGRHFFLIPWKGRTIIGTTDKEFPGDPSSYHVRRESIEGLLEEVNSSFGNSRPLEYKDVKFAYGGLRPLVDSSGGVYESSRKYEIRDNIADGVGGMISVEGGKFTTSRNLAERAVDMAVKKLGMRLPASATSKRHLEGSEIDDMEEFVARAIEKHSRYDPVTIEYLARNYGTEFEKILKIAAEEKKMLTPIGTDGEIFAELAYAVRSEMALHLDDALMRRSGIAALGDPGGKAIEQAAAVVGAELKWDNNRIKIETDRLRKALAVPDN
jgi:glycerol-3-phosphate dehydrogenase